MMLDTAQILMLFGLALAFGGYFGLTFRKHQAGREMIQQRDERLYPPDYDQLTKTDRRRLYRIHTWAAVWDPVGKLLAAIALGGVLMFIYSILLATVKEV